MKTFNAFNRLVKNAGIEAAYIEAMRYGKIVLDLRTDFDRNVFLNYNGFFIETYSHLGEISSIQVGENKPPYLDHLITLNK